MTGANVLIEQGSSQVADLSAADTRTCEQWIRFFSRFVEKQHHLVVFVVLAAIEVLIFSHSISRADFFVDDWLILSSLTFGPQDFMGMVRGQLADPTQLVRPVESPYFAVLFKLFGYKAQLYHYLNAAMEIAGAFCLYGTLRKLWRSSALGVCAATIFIVNPTHDATHYWMLCSSATLSVMLFLLAFWTMLEGVERNRPALRVLAGITMTLSAFNYECCIALPILLAPAVIMMCQKDVPFKALLPRSLNAAFFLCLPGLMLVLYQRILAPLFGDSWVRHVALDLPLFANTLVRGLTVQSPFTIFSTLITPTAFMQLSHDPFGLAKVVIGTLIVGVTVFVFLNTEAQERVKPAAVILFGLVYILVSMVVYGLNADYMPELVTPINRVNLCASIGASITTVGCLSLITRTTGKHVPGIFANTAVALLVAGIFAFFSVCDLILAKPWIASTLVQRQILQTVTANAKTLAAGNGILLVNCPRYCLWAPVCDGTWDFESMIKVALNRSDIHATVLSDYIRISPWGLEDVRNGREIARLPFDSLFLLFPQSGVRRISSAMDFCAVIKQRGSAEFGVSDQTQRQWRHSLESRQ